MNFSDQARDTTEKHARLARFLPLRRDRMGDFLDIMNPGEQPPLRVDFSLAAKRLSPLFLRLANTGSTMAIRSDS